MANVHPPLLTLLWRSPIHPSSLPSNFCAHRSSFAVTKRHFARRRKISTIQLLCRRSLSAVRVARGTRVATSAHQVLARKRRAVALCQGSGQRASTVSARLRSALSSATATARSRSPCRDREAVESFRALISHSTMLAMPLQPPSLPPPPPMSASAPAAPAPAPVASGKAGKSPRVARNAPDGGQWTVRSRRYASWRVPTLDGGAAPGRSDFTSRRLELTCLAGLICDWDGCGTTHPDPDALYTHVRRATRSAKVTGAAVQLAHWAQGDRQSVPHM